MYQVLQHYIWYTIEFNMDSESVTITATSNIDSTKSERLSENVVVTDHQPRHRTTTTTTPPPSAPPPRRRRSSGWWSAMYLLLVHLLTLSIYAVPLYVSSRTNREEAVLDELHIVSPDHHDINGVTTLQTILTNDYWGRPLTYPASHKSWRPLTILSFRYLRGIARIMSDLMMHRCVNVLTHAATADLVGRLAVALAPHDNNSDDSQTFWIFVVAKLCFALHPTHVEVVVNAANRSHIVSVLLAVYASDPSVPFLFFLIAVVGALLSSETALFQIVPIAMTIIAISYTQTYHGRRPAPRPRGNMIGQLFATTVHAPHILLRILWLGLAAVTYYGGRWYFDTLSIPEGLIRPAENPFFPLTGWKRFYSYAMVLGVHLAKQYDYDYIGFSHEYGFNCVAPIDTWDNVRLLPVLLMVLTHALVGCILLLRQRRRRTIAPGLIFYLVTLAWTFTLFPISGIVKVGTFISDRIVVASTVPIAMLQAYGITTWLRIGFTRRTTNSSTNGATKTSWIDTILNQRIQRKLCLLGMIFVLAWRRIHLRSLEWMSSVTLLESSLRTCPQFAKGHLEISKIYSGLYPEKLNLTQARDHLNQAERIDPNYCDVHFQFALLEAREHRYIPFEKRLVNALQCGFTMGQAHPIWHQYWPNALDETHNSPTIVAESRKRYESYMSILAKAIEQEERQEQKSTQNKSPFVFK